MAAAACRYRLACTAARSCLIEPLIAPDNRILALTSDRSTIAEVAGPP